MRVRCSGDVKNPEPGIVDEQLLRLVRLVPKKGRVELRTENSADLALILSVIIPAQKAPTVDSSLRM
jgi:hypothetical protein